MEKIVVRNSNELSQLGNPRIGNVVFNYTGYDKPIHATPIVMENGEVVILTNMRAAAGRSRVILQDLTGAEIKTLLNVGFENAEVTRDEDSIYIFTSNSKVPKLYTFDSKTFRQTSSMPLGSACIQSVCCDKEHLYTFDMDSGEVQTRAKDGSIISTEDTRRRSGPFTVTSNHNMYVTSTGVHYAGIGDLGLTDEYREQLEQRFGKEFMDLNYSYDSLAFDEKTQTTYVGSRNLVFVATPDGIKGVMYFQDKSIMGLDIDPVTKSLMISASNWPESDQSVSFDKGGSLEILPTDMVDKRIQESMQYLEGRQKRERMAKIGHDIVDLSDGNFESMIYLLGKAKDMGEDFLPILDALTTPKVKPDEIISTAETYIQQTSRMLPDKSSPLQKREEQLSVLEQEADKISKAEKLIEQQNEKGNQIGE